MTDDHYGSTAGSVHCGALWTAVCRGVLMELFFLLCILAGVALLFICAVAGIRS